MKKLGILLLYIIPMSAYCPTLDDVKCDDSEQRTCKSVIDYIEQDIANILPTMIMIESNNNHNAIGDGGKALGLLQIHKQCVQDVNRTYNTQFIHQQMTDSIKAVTVFKLYLIKGINRYISKYRKFPQQHQIVRMWNGGIYQGYKINDTKKYFEKFQSKRLLKDN